MVTPKIDEEKTEWVLFSPYSKKRVQDKNKIERVAKKRIKGLKILMSATPDPEAQSQIQEQITITEIKLQNRIKERKWGLYG